MSTNEHDSPENGNRATVALVNAEVGRVSDKVDGLKELIKSEFKDVGRRLDEFAGLESRVRDLELSDARHTDNTGALSDLDDRVSTLEQEIVTGDQVKAALEFDRDQRRRTTDAQFTKREKILGTLIALSILGLQLHALVH